MCKRNCETCEGNNDKSCMKGIDLSTIKDKCDEWFPSKCPITGMTFSGLILEEDGRKTPVYSFSPYTSYTLPQYDERYKEFTREKFDEDAGGWDDSYETLGTLEEIEEEVSKDNFEAIKQFYNIQE